MNRLKSEENKHPYINMSNTNIQAAVIKIKKEQYFAKQFYV